MESSESINKDRNLENTSAVQKTDKEIIQESDREYTVAKQLEDEVAVKEILDEIIDCPAVFQSQQIGDPELIISEKIKIAEELLFQKPVTFLLKFGEYLKEKHLNYILKKFSTFYEVEYYVKNLKSMLNDHNKKIITKNRRYEAMKKMEAEGIYFSEEEMEKREPLLYHQMVGQYLSEKEKFIKNKQSQGNVIPSFSNFLLNQMERDELSLLVKSQQAEEDKMHEIESSTEEEEKEEVTVHKSQQQRWGEDWEEEKSRTKLKTKQPKKKNICISKKEKKLLLQEFQSIMKNNFLAGKDSDFNYSEVDYNDEYDSVDLKNQDEEEKYFDEETNDNTAVCTDTGIQDY